MQGVDVEVVHVGRVGRGAAPLLRTELFYLQRGRVLRRLGKRLERHQRAGERVCGGREGRKGGREESQTSVESHMKHTTTIVPNGGKKSNERLR